MLTEVAVFEAQEIKHTVETDGVDALLSISHHTGLRMEGNTQTSLSDHRQVVGTISHSNRLGEIHLLHLCYQFQQLSLTMTINDLPDIASGKFTILADFQFIGIHIVDAIATLQVFSEIGKTTRKDGNLIATGLQD